MAQVVGSSPSIERNAEVKAALNALDELVKRQSNVSTVATNGKEALINRSLADIDPETLEKPPWEAASLVLARAAGMFIIATINLSLHC